MDYPGRILAIDLGDRRVGLAMSDPTRLIAQPAGFIERRAGKRPPLTALLAKAAEVGATAFVVGLPLDEAGENTPRALEARRLALELETRTGHPARLLDERFTTAAALRAVKAMDGSTHGRRGDVDALAATVLLEQALAHGARLWEDGGGQTADSGGQTADSGGQTADGGRQMADDRGTGHDT